MIICLNVTLHVIFHSFITYAYLGQCQKYFGPPPSGTDRRWGKRHASI